MNLKEFLEQVEGRYWAEESAEFPVALAHWRTAIAEGLIAGGTEHHAAQDANQAIDLIGGAKLTDAGRQLIAQG